MRRLGVSRAQLFADLDRPALLPLPPEPFVYAEWRLRRVALDYHVEIDGHFYSVPHRFIKQQVDARITAGIIELFHKSRRARATRSNGRSSFHAAQHGDLVAWTCGRSWA